MFYKYALYTLFLSILFSGCSSSKQSALSENIVKPVSKSKYISQSGYYFVLIEKENKKWKIIQIQETPIEKIKNTKQEILRVSQDYKEVEPYFVNAMPKSPINRYDCTQSINTNQYNQCTSDLTSPYVGATVAKNIVSVLTLTSTSGSHRYIDKKLIDEAIEQTNLFDAIEEKKKTLEKEQEYKRSFNEAKTVDEYNAFIEKYLSVEGASSLVALAVQNRNAIIEKKKIEEEDKNIEEQNRKREEERLTKVYEQKIYKNEKQLEKENLSLAKMEQRAIENYTKNIENFRKNIKKGIETNCGLVVDVKESQAKIDLSQKNSVQELWIDSKKLFPKGHGCRFVNGKYIAPATF